jgi:hypothetical protein
MQAEFVIEPSGVIEEVWDKDVIGRRNRRGRIGELTAALFMVSERKAALGSRLPDSRNPFVMHARCEISVAGQLALQRCVLEIRADRKHDDGQRGRQQTPQRTQCQRNANRENVAEDVSWMANIGVGAGRYHMVIAIRLNAHAGLKMSINRLRPS